MTEESNFSLTAIKRTATQLKDLSDKKRKQILESFPTNIKFRIIEEMIRIKKNEVL